MEERLQTKHDRQQELLAARLAAMVAIVGAGY